MKIITLLLDSTNSHLYKGITIGQGISLQNKEYLWSEREKPEIDVIVIHYISAVNITSDTPFSLSEVLNIFVTYGVSSHYLISRDGVIYKLVPEEKKAWHCGPSIMPYPDRRVNVNEFSIGIELMGTAESGFTELQYLALSDLCYDIMIRHNKKFSFVGHDQVAGVEAVSMKLRSEAKVDPGSRFNWSRFYDDMELIHIQ